MDRWVDDRVVISSIISILHRQLSQGQQLLLLLLLQSCYIAFTVVVVVVVVGFAGSGSRRKSKWR